MATQEIPCSEWPAFFASFSRAHEGWLCSVAASPYAPLREVAVAGDGSIAIDLHAHMRHVVHRPARVFNETDDRGADEGLRIETRARDVVALRFRVAALPESVDGLAVHAP